MEVIFNVQPLPVWDWRVASDLYFGGMGVGTFLFAVLADWHFGGKQKQLCRTAAYLSPFLVIFGEILLMAKLGHPSSVFYLFLSFHPGSAIWWGAWLQLIFVAGAFVYAFWWEDESKEVARHRLGWALSPLALSVGAYHGFLLTTFEVRALWSGSTVVASILAFVTTGMAITLVVHLWRSRREGRMHGEQLGDFLHEIHEIRYLVGVTIMTELFVFAVWWLSLKAGNAAEQAALAAANAAFGPIFWSLGIGLGLILPLLVGLGVVLKRPELPASVEINSIWATSVMILLGGFVIRWGIVLGGQAGTLNMNLG